MKINAIIQARLGSTRLPGKIMKRVGGKPLLQYVAERVDAAMGIDKVYVAMPVNDLAHLDIDWEASAYVLGCFAPADDVAARFREVLERFPCDAFVRICADSPLIDPAIITAVVSTFRAIKPKIARSGYTFPPGQHAEVVETAFFMEEEPTLIGDSREHVTEGLYSRTDDFVTLQYDGQLQDDNLVVDTQEDLDRFERIVSKMTRPHWTYGWRECLSLAQQP